MLVDEAGQAAVCLTNRAAVRGFVSGRIFLSDQRTNKRSDLFLDQQKAGKNFTAESMLIIIYPLIVISLALMLLNLESTVSAEATESNDCGKRHGETYKICPRHLSEFQSKGLAILDDILTEEEISSIETIYNDYMSNGSPDKQGKDFCDMSKPFDTPRDQYSVINAMLPRIYYPELQGNIYEKVAASIARQLFSDVEMVIDYDQLLDKSPGASDAVFAWHQDMAYWPPPSMTPDTRTVTFSLALDSTTLQNGCIKYIPGSGVNKSLRNHNPLGKNREESHAIQIAVDETAERVEFAQVRRGSASIHDEYVVHGSGGNLSNKSRRTYVIAFRTKKTVETERAAGFTHSHNDKVNWDVFNKWGSDSNINNEL
jgi:phytanoyl-CoA hydroxylase